WDALDGNRVQIVFGPDHKDTLVFNEALSEFEQLIKGGPRSFQGARAGSPPKRESIYGLTGQVRGVHDPCIIEANGWYYVFSTGDSRNIPIWRSKDLRHWENYGNVFEAVPKWAKDLVPPAGKSAIMAPDIVFWKGKYYLTYCVASTKPPFQPP